MTNTRQKTIEIVDAISMPLKILKIFTLLPIEVNQKWKKSLHVIWRLCVCFMMLSFIIPLIVPLFLSQNIQTFAVYSFMSLTQVTLIFKSITIYMNWSKIKYLRNFISNPIFRGILPEERKEFIRLFSECRIIRIVFFDRSLATVILGWGVMLFIKYYKYRLLSVPARYPIDMESMINYTIMYSYQIICLLFSAIINLAIDLLLVYLLLTFNTALKNLGHRLELMSKSAEEVYDNFVLNLHDGLFDDDHNRRTLVAEMILTYKLNKIHKGVLPAQIIFNQMHHKIIFHLIEETMMIFSKIAFAQIVTSALVLCSAGFRFLHADNYTAKILFVLYIITMAAQIGCPCYAGNELMATSTEISTRIYFSNFLEFNKKESQYLRQLMMYISKGITVNAGAIFKFPLNMRTFLSIIRFAYSLMALMVNLE